MNLRFATRASRLARQQTASVMHSLEQAWPGLSCQEMIMSTRGDRDLSHALPEIGGKGLFTQELETEILAGNVDAAVHSLKDLPVEDPDGLTIGAIPARQDPRDVLVSAKGFKLDTLPRGARVGTSSPRRAAQLLAVRPDLQIESLRGNIDTRLQKARQGEYDAIVLASAGLLRLEHAAAISEWLPLEVMLPAPGQAALAVQCRAADSKVLEYLQAIEVPSTRMCIQAERAFLSGLGGGCAVPVAAYAELKEDGMIHLRGVVASLDGSRLIRVEAASAEPLSLGKELARQALEAGAGSLLKV